jgi:glycosyltransferase involved in cell wall biosynthesis
MTAGTIEVGICPAVGGRRAPLRVLFLAQRYFPYMGGLETHVYEVARRMVEAGVEVTVLTTDTGGTLPATDEVNGVRIERVRAWPAERDYYFAPGLYRAVQRGDWDVIHCQGCHTLFAPLAMFAAWRSGRPYVVSFHSGGPPNGLRRAIRRAQWTALRPLLARARRLVAVSKSEVVSFGHDLGLSKDRFTIIRNGSEMPPVPAVAPQREAGTLIVSPGRLQEYKGHHRLIAALPYIIAERPDARLLILGAGPYEAELRQLARATGVAERVEIRSIPPERREEMAATLAGADIVTLLSEYEAHPIAVLEALALRLSVLVADTSGFRELAEEGLVRAIPLESSAPEIAGAVLRQLNDPLNPGELHLPTWDDCTGQLLDLYRDVTREVRCAY